MVQPARRHLLANRRRRNSTVFARILLSIEVNEAHMEHLKQIVHFNMVLGAWLMIAILGGWMTIAPFVMGYSISTIEVANDVALGVLLIGCSWWILAAAAWQAGAATLGLLAGIWLIAAPFVLHYQRLSRAFANDIGVGILSVLISATGLWLFVSRLRSAA
jgi:hypothetical protein